MPSVVPPQSRVAAGDTGWHASAAHQKKTDRMREGIQTVQIVKSPPTWSTVKTCGVPSSSSRKMMPIDHESYDQGASLLYASEPFNVTCRRKQEYEHTQRCGSNVIPRSSVHQVYASQDPEVSIPAHTPNQSPYVRAQ